MKKLITKLQRLYFLPEQAWHSWKPGDKGEPTYSAEGRLMPEILASCLEGEANAALSLVSPEGMVRAMVVSVERGCDWRQVAALYQGVQEDLDLPAPAISVSVEDGYQVWFSLAEPIPLQKAQRFLNGLRLKYLADIPLAKLKFRPAAAASLKLVPLVPAQQKSTGRWSAFIDPAMGSMFVDESWLEMPPNLSRQADMLAGIESIKAKGFDAALSILQSLLETLAASSVPSASLPGDAISHPGSALSVGSNFTDPKRFLLAVMNDPSARAEHRIKAARALLPYFGADASKVKNLPEHGTI